MLGIEIIIIGAILILQPLIAMLWAYLVFRLVAGYAAKRAEKAVDGRIDRIEEKLR